MQQLTPLLQEITLLTLKIEEQYPELYNHLNETPMTLASGESPEINKSVLTEYLESLKQILNHYVEEHKAMQH